MIEATLENLAGKGSAVKREIRVKVAFLDYQEPRESGDFQVQLEHLAKQVTKVVMVMGDSLASQD